MFNENKKFVLKKSKSPFIFNNNKYKAVFGEQNKINEKKRPHSKNILGNRNNSKNRLPIKIDNHINLNKISKNDNKLIFNFQNKFKKEDKKIKIVGLSEPHLQKNKKIYLANGVNFEKNKIKNNLIDNNINNNNFSSSMKKPNSQNNKILLRNNIKKIQKDEMKNLPLIKNDSMTNIKFVNEENFRPDNLIPIKLSNDLKKGFVVKKNYHKLPLDEKSKVEGFINKKKRIHSANKFQNNLINHKNNNNNIIFNNNKLIIDNKIFLKNRRNNLINDKRNNIIFNIQINQKISNKIRIGEPLGNHIKNNLIEQNKGIDNKNLLNINKGEAKIKLNKNNLIHQNLNENNENEDAKLINQKKENNDNYPKIIDYFYKEEKNQKFNEKMEDFILIKHPFLEIENNHLSLFAVFDGHGGEYVSQYLKENFCEFLTKTINTKYNSRFTQILKESIENIDKYFDNLEEAKQCGSTGTIVVVNNRSIYCANVGDSKCYYINETEAMQLTEDHNCTNKIEVDTLKSRGVAVFMGRVFGSLSLTRSFGDTEFKKDGITSTPYIKKIFSDKKNIKYLGIASDGIWDVVANKMLFQISKELKEGTPEEFCNNLVDYALKNNSNDNISCIVIRFGNKN